ncbi:MAG: hypothetical protein ACI9R3_002530 [Verrucomicrobiales bacterium]|jgi:hypothetical protein
MADSTPESPENPGGETFYNPETGQYFTVDAEGERIHLPGSVENVAGDLELPDPVSVEGTIHLPSTPRKRQSLYDAAAEAAFEQGTPLPQAVEPSAEDLPAELPSIVETIETEEPAMSVVPPAFSGPPVIKPRQGPDKQVMTVAVLAAVVLHMVVIAGLAAWIVKVFKAPPPALVVQSMPTPEDDEIMQQTFNPTVQPTPSSPSSMAAPMITAAAVSPVAAPPVEEFTDTFGIGIDDGLGDGLDGWGDGMGGGFEMPQSMIARCTKGDRDKRLAESGGTPEGQQAVLNALRWLKKTQNQDGSWGMRWHASMTGLALLSFLGHCETPDSPEFGDTVINGIMFLAEQGMQTEGRLGRAGNQFAYEHAIATYALSEAYTMSRYGKRKIPNVREVLQLAVPIIINGQTADGGWYYGYESTTPGDTSVVGWNVQALNAARYTQLKFDGMEEAWENIGNYLTVSQNEEGNFGYRGSGGGRGYSMTGVGCLSMIMHGKMKSHRLNDGVRYLMKSGKISYTAVEADIYGWYYITQVMFLQGGGNWKRWNGWFQKEIISGQSADGSFKREGPGGDLDTPTNGTKGAGPDEAIYRTTLCTLMLEVYYRYLPATDSKSSKSGLDALK